MAVRMGVTGSGVSDPYSFPADIKAGSDPDPDPGLPMTKFW
jgi:hypothetical protein